VKRGKMVVRETDYIQQLANYVKKNLAKGYTTDSLRFALGKQNYSRTAIDRAITLANEQLAKEAPLMKEKPLIKYEVISKSQGDSKFKKSFWEKIKDFFR